MFFLLSPALPKVLSSHNLQSAFTYKASSVSPNNIKKESCSHYTDGETKAQGDDMTIQRELTQLVETGLVSSY